MPPEAIPPRDEGILGQGIAEITENTVESEGSTQPNLMMLTVEGEAQGLPTERAEGITGKEKDEEVQNLAGEIKGKKQGPWTKVQGSYAAAVQKNVEMQKVELAIEEIDGLPTARIPNSVFEDAHPLWEDFLVGRFLAKAPFIGGIHALVNKIWTLGDKSVQIDVFVVDQKTVRFRIKDERTRLRVLRRGRWNLCGVPVVLTKWSPIAEAEQDEIKTIPLWVIIKNVPQRYFSWKVLSAITSPLGTPKKLHPDTEACKSFDEAKVFVEVDLTKTLPKHFCFKSDKGGDTIVEFVYPWLPPRCIECSKWGHLKSDCKSKKKEQGVEEKKTLVDNVVLLDEQSTQTQEKCDKNSNVLKTESSRTKEVMDQEETMNEGDRGWSTPIKVVRSPVKSTELRYGEVSIMSNSFSCLSDKGEVEEAENLEAEENNQVEQKEDEKELVTEGSHPMQEEEGKNKDTKEVGVTLRQSIPRVSKDNHKVVSTTGVQNTRNHNPTALRTRQSKTNH